MAVNYPDGVDSFNEPSLPEFTALSSAGTATRNHVEHHRDLGDAVEALEANAAFKDHDHSGDGTTAHGNKLEQINTHESADTDTATSAMHHTLGTGAWQAAPGNHVHSYNQLLDRPYIVCTTTTRPTNPFIGMQIYETDTNTVRVWATFPTNPQATGVIVVDNFNRDDLEDIYWTLHYHLTPITYGIFRIFSNLALAAYKYWVRWEIAQTVNNWVLCRRSHDSDQQTDSDDQELESDWGDDDYDHHHEYGEVDDAPCNDHYFRMSDDHLHYVRVAIHWKWIVVHATHDGHDNEIILGTLFIPAWEPRIKWRIRWIDWECHVWRNGIYCGSIVDHDHYHYRDSDHRHWGFGCHVKGHPLGQWRPPPFIHCEMKDVVSYTPATRWGLLPVASVPILVAESTEVQEIRANIKVKIKWGHIKIKWIGPVYLDVVNAPTDIVIQEPGVYHVSASLAWHPVWTYHDHSCVEIEVNGQDVARKNWSFIRGYNYVPGFPQTNEISFWYRFNAGDVVRVNARHNAPRSSWLWFYDVDPDRQVSHIELIYHTP